MKKHPSEQKYRAYLEKYPDGEFKIFAVDELKKYDETTSSSTPYVNPNTAKSAIKSVLKTETITVNGVGFDMIAIKGGQFQMGSNPESERRSNEKQHDVTVTDFQMGKYEVTQKQWQAVMNDTPAHFKGDNLPVEQVSWDDTQVFISKLNQATAKTGHKFSLPTEAQWEYAARAGTNASFYPYDGGKGDCISTMYANFDSNHDYNDCGAKNQNAVGKTMAVDSYKPNKFGLYNITGNVWEWTCSVYVENYDGSEASCDSVNAPASLRVVRGGSWFVPPEWLRLASRGSYIHTARVDYIGFRLSRM
ncbi:MAG: SUMF1/EgtB/PvdO family nonheme iron enzyme [Methylococcales bacterium]|nr:SUMF1/EgtB/PvdO family nonheme iron enzyme [Methylococcales bacterium]